MLGFRGASRDYRERYRAGFALECRAIKSVREDIGLDNVIGMIPFCRTMEEADKVLTVRAEHGLVRGKEVLGIDRGSSAYQNDRSLSLRAMRGGIMKTVVGIFASRADAERAIERLRGLGIPQEHINYLIPGVSPGQLDDVPTTDAEPPGVGTALGGVIGGVTGASGGLLGAAVASAFVPVIGPVTAIGLAAAALLGLGGAVAGAAAGGALDEALSEGLPKDELFVYGDALRQGRTVVVVLTDEAAETERVQEVLAQAGAESLDAAREHWWLGLRDAEAETYTAEGGDFTRDETLYRQGFEAALHTGTSGRPYEEILEFLRTYYADVYGEESFRRGYARGRAYQEGLQERYGRPEPGPGRS